MNKILTFICLVLLVACNKDYELKPCSLYVTDSKPCTDSLSEVWHNYSNARSVELHFVIKNNTGKSLYLPIETEHDNSDNISVCLTNKQDTIIPKFTIKKVPYNSNIINANDSIRLFIKLCRFPDWQISWCNVGTDVKEVISMLRISYHKSNNPPNASVENAYIGFDDIQTNYTLYVIPPGEIMDEL